MDRKERTRKSRVRSKKSKKSSMYRSRSCPIYSTMCEASMASIHNCRRIVLSFANMHNMQVYLSMSYRSTPVEHCNQNLMTTSGDSAIFFNVFLIYPSRRSCQRKALTQKPLRPQTTRAMDIENIDNRTTKLMLGFSSGDRSAMSTDDWRDSSGAALAVEATASTPLATSTGATKPSEKEKM